LSHRIVVSRSAAAGGDAASMSPLIEIRKVLNGRQPREAPRRRRGFATRAAAPREV
jgi:hypothetical protein